MSSPRPAEGLHQAADVPGPVLFFITFVVLSFSKLLLAQASEGAAMDAGSTRRHQRPPCTRRKRTNAIALTLSWGHGLRRVLAGLDPGRDHAPGMGGWPRHPHADDAAAAGEGGSWLTPSSVPS